MIRELNSASILLFGVFDRSDKHEGSDADMMVIANFKEGFLGGIKTLLDLNVGLPLEPIGYTPGEFKKMKKYINPFILDITGEGKMLYEVIT